MELMSSLLFCALVAHLPQAFGESKQGIQSNNSMVFHKMPMTKKDLLNIDGPPLVNSDPKTVNVNCSQCVNCKDQTIKGYKTHDQISELTPNFDEHKQLLKTHYRNKRESGITTTEKNSNKAKQTKSKKKTTKSVTVTKYNVDGYVYAIKVKETNTTGIADQQKDTHVSTCQVFSVKKTFPCDTAEVELFLTDAKKKINKKHTKTGAASSTKSHFMAPLFRKRQVDNSQVPDNFMPSIEDLY